MDPLFGIPPPAWRANKETGFADIAISPRELFYHDLPADEAAHHVAELTPQSLKALFEGGEYVWDGWKEVPNWYIGTIEDRGLPVVLQRVQVGMARGQGAVVHHSELRSSHSPFLSKPDEVIATILEAVETVTGLQVQDSHPSALIERKNTMTPQARLNAPTSWIKYGLPLTLGRGLGYAIAGFMAFRSLWKRS